MNITVFGIEDADLSARIAEAATRRGLHLSTLDDRSLLASAPSSDQDDWEILVIGPNGSSLQALAAEVNAALERHPIGAVVAFDPTDNDRVRADCMQAGALDVLGPACGTESIGLILERAVRSCERYERHLDTEKLQVITQLTAGINHEINNPLTGLLGTAELMLLENDELTDKHRKDIQTIITQARRIQAIATRLRHLDRLRTTPYDDKTSMIDLSESSADDELEIQKIEEAAQTHPGLPRVLVVDDNRLIHDLIEGHLGGRINFDHAISSCDALSELQYGDYDLALMDAAMPDMDGLELFRAARRMKPQLRVLMMGKPELRSHLGKALEEGALGFLRKPLKFDELEKTLWGAIKDRMQSGDSAQ